MASTKVKLLRPLDGKPIGSFADYPADDAKALAANGVVEIVAKKAAPPVQNKMAVPPINKAALKSRLGKVS